MLPLFRREVVLSVLASGSSGNCTYVGDGRSGVLVDCGISTRRILKAMERVGLGDAPVDAVLVTHEHRDHVGAARVLCDRLARRRGRPVPFFLTAGTAGNLRPGCTPAARETVAPGESVRLGGLVARPFGVPHDVAEPVAWRIEVGEAAVAILTDLGRPTALVRRAISEVDALVLEFNHDEEMLLSGPYPWHLKQRIRSNHGHLSNAQAARLLAEVLSPRLRHLVLAHLSEENNTPARAVAAARRVLGDAEVAVHVADQRHGAAPVRLEAGTV